MASWGLSATKPQFISLPTKSKQQLAYTLTKIKLGKDVPTSNEVFIVFINGLALPQSSWEPTIDILRQNAQISAPEINTTLTVLTYDRPGQGLSQPPNTPPPQPHDILASVEELHCMITSFRPTTVTTTTSQAKILLVAHSIGVPLARLYIQQHPYTVSALIGLDPNMANTDWISLFPDPDSLNFNPNRDLPSDTTVQQLREGRANIKHLFHPAAPNPELLDRVALQLQLPYSDRPVLYGCETNEQKQQPNTLYIRIIGHDPQTFIEESLKILTAGLTQKYLEPVWQRYNTEHLTLATAWPNHILIAKGSGHFVQRNRPDYVAEQVLDMLSLLV